MTNSLTTTPRRVDAQRSAWLWLIFSVLPIDGFPAGSIVLREFGARISNFFLLPLLFIWVSREILARSPSRFSKRELIIALVVLLGIPALNLPIAILLQPDTPPGALVADWCKQYGMLLWGLVSFLTWRKVLSEVTPLHLCALICVGTVIPLIGFFGDFTGSAGIQGILALFRASHFTRPSGLATEPSLYAAWLAFVWPMVLYYIRKSPSFASRTSGVICFAALCASAVLSNARTIAAIVVLQLVYYGYWVTQRTSGIKRLRALSILGACGLAIIGAFAASLSTLADAEVGSNISRIGSTVTAIRVSLAHPISGIGIGQLKYFFGAYAPDFALASDEILTHAAGLSDYRASSFNLFVRFVCEFGFGLGLWLSFIVLKPLALGVRRASTNEFLPYATLVAIGGVGFWLTQDQYGYQPGIISLAILSNLLSHEPNELNSATLRGSSSNPQ